MRFEEPARLRELDPVFPIVSTPERVQPRDKTPTRRLGGFTFNPARSGAPRLAPARPHLAVCSRQRTGARYP